MRNRFPCFFRIFLVVFTLFQLQKSKKIWWNQNGSIFFLTSQLKIFNKNTLYLGAWFATLLVPQLLELQNDTHVYTWITPGRVLSILVECNHDDVWRERRIAPVRYPNIQAVFSYHQIKSDFPDSEDELRGKLSSGIFCCHQSNCISFRQVRTTHKLVT